MTEPLRLAVVGHTNVGKTSFLRTLMRDAAFGEVSSRASTTRHVEGASLQIEGQPALELFDTPGLEDAMSLLDYLEQLRRPGERCDGPALLTEFLRGTEAQHRFAQETKVLRRLLASDAGLYVIDARESVLPKYLDESQILSLCGKPLFPVLNFVASSDNRAEEWREAMARRGLHALLSFDSVAPPVDGEKRLYQSLALMLPDAGPTLERLIVDREAQAAARRRSACRLIAELLIDVAALRQRVAAEPEAVEQAVGAMRRRVREREQQCTDALLRLYGFRQEDAVTGELPLADGRWQDDLFHPETLKQLGVRVGGGLAAGTAAGAGLDLMVGGITLGAGTILGGLAGGVSRAGRQFSVRLLGKLRGARQLSVDDAILAALALRQRQLLRALEARGHAAQQPVSLNAPKDDWLRGKLPPPLATARAHPEWSSLDERPDLEQANRQAQVGALAEEIKGSVD
ncbi:MAG: GTPase/DUF3482 domain-containing protein [Halofilum sp. (in: g-proteobacteria)]